MFRTAPIKWRAALAFAGVFLLFSLISAVIFRPWLNQFSSVLIGPPENNLQDLWNIWYAAHAGLHHFFVTDLVRFPQGALLNYHSFAYPYVAAIVVLTRWLGSAHSTLVWLDNASQFISFPLTGAAAYVLTYRFCRNHLAALVGGFVFAFNPSHVGQLMHHAHVTHIEFLPLFVLAYLNAVDKQSRAWLAAAIGFAALSALCCWYYLFYAAYFAAFHTAYRHWHDNEPWRLKTPVTCFVGVVVILSPLIIPMLGQTGRVETPGGSDAFVTDVEALIAFPPTHLLAAWSQSFWTRLQTWTSNNTFEGAAYLGLINIALMAWLWRRERALALRDRRLPYLLWGMGVFLVIAAGDCLHAFGFDTLIPLPGLILSHLPVVGQVRTPGRAMVMVYLFLSIGVSTALALLMQEMQQKWAKPALLAIAALIVADFVPLHLDTTDARCSPGFAVIASDPEQGFGVGELPLADTGDIAMFHQTCHGRPVLQAAVSRAVRPALIDRITGLGFSDQRQALTKANVKYLIVNERGTWTPDPNPPKYALRRWAVHTFPGLAKYKFIAPPKPSPAVPKAAYLKAFPAVYRSPDLTILRLR